MARGVAPLSPNDGLYIRDTVQSPDFLEMEESSPDVLGTNVEDVMGFNPLTMSPNTPAFEAISNMGLKH